MERRRQLILDRLEQQGTCTYEELARLAGVSSMTIRRDVDSLAERGALIRITGGIQKAPTPSFLYESAFQSRLALERPAKKAIARAALELVNEQDTLFIDGSTTCVELARLLTKERKGLTIVTNSALVCIELGKSSENVVIGIGGQFEANSLSYIGAQAEDWAKTLFMDLAFFSGNGFLPEEGTFESGLSSFRIKQIIARQCVEVVLLADHTKFGQRSLSKVLDVSQIHTVVTDSGTPRQELAKLERSGKKVCLGAVEKWKSKGAAHAAQDRAEAKASSTVSSF